MQNLFSAFQGQRARRQATLAFSLLVGAASPAFAQIPSTIYVLGKVIATGAPTYFEVNPANLATTTVGDLPVLGTAKAITGLLDTNQPLLAIDVRPSNGQIYALAYNTSTQLAQLYTLSTSTSALTPVGGSIPLNLQDTNIGTATGNSGNTLGATVNIGFDFNPRIDRIRVVAPNGTNYVLNPNNGTLQATNTPLTYTAPAYVGRVPYIGAVAYTNSQLGLTGTTLYDVDIANTNGLLARQNQPNNGTLDLAAPLRFALRQANGAYDLGPTGNGYPLNSPTNRIDIDIAYDQASATNRYYVLESRSRTAGGYTINLYEVTQATLTTGTANNSAIIAYGENITGLAAVNYYDIAAFGTAPKTWTGQVSTNWADGGNWFPVGVPTSSDNILVPGNGFLVAAANYTVVQQPTVRGTQNVGSITLSDKAVLTLANGSVLNDFGNFANNGSSVAGDATATNGGTGTLVLAGAGNTPQEISGTTATTFPNLQVITTGATTISPVSVQRSLTVSGTLKLNSTFTLLSTADGTAYVVNQGSGTVDGTATVQRYITPTNSGAGYRHYSSPVSGNTVADFATSGFAPVVNPDYNSSATPSTVRPFPNIYTYDQSRLGLTNTSPEFDKGFQSPGATSEAIATAAGYTVNIGASALVDFQGTLNNGTYTRGNLTRGTQATAGWQFLGNPYPSALDYDVVRANSAGIESALFVYKSNGQYSGTYTSYVNGQGANTGTRELPLGQGFFVRTASGQTGTVNFTNAARLTAPETALFQRTAADSRPSLALTLRSGTVANQTRVYFEQGATAAFDAKFDAPYLPATHGLDLATDASAEALSINGLPALTGAVAVPLRVHAPAAGTYTLAVDELNNLPAGYHAYLRDGSTGTYTDLAATPSVSLALTPADAPSGRYALLITAASPLAAAPATLAALAAVFPNPAHGTATLILPQALRGTSASTVQLLNILGQVVLTKTVAAGVAPTVELSLNGIAPGIYTVRASTEAGMVAKRLVVQ
jgi:hypothetical protein